MSARAACSSATTAAASTPPPRLRRCTRRKRKPQSRQSPRTPAGATRSKTCAPTPAPPAVQNLSAMRRPPRRAAPTAGTRLLCPRSSAARSSRTTSSPSSSARTRLSTRSSGTIRKSRSSRAPFLSRITLKRFRAFTSPSGCTTVRATWTRNLRRPAHRATRRGNSSSQRLGISTLSAAEASASSVFRWTPRRRCQTNTWTPSSRTTTAKLRPFSTAYLPGYLADRYDVSAEESAGRADARCRESCIQAISSTILGYDSCVPTSADVRLHSRRVKYAMMPVWMLHTKWNGKDYLFSMNGQTGKLTGDLPVSMGRFWAWFAGIFVPLAGVMMLLFV